MSIQEVHEVFKETLYFVTLGGFTSHQDFNNFMRAQGVEKHLLGWPVFAVMRVLNAARKNRTVAGSLQEELTTVKIEKEKTLIAIKRQDYISRDLAVARIRITLMATASKIKYAIKLASPRVCGMCHAPDVEIVLTECYNQAMEQLLSEAEQIESWEVYGTQNQGSNLLPSGVSLADTQEEDTSEGSGEADTPVWKEQYTGTSRLVLNALHRRPNQSDRSPQGQVDRGSGSDTVS